MLGLLNVKYVLTCSRPSGLRHLRLLDVDRDISIYQDLCCLPRPFIVHRVRESEDSQDVLSILQNPEFDLVSEIILEKSPPRDFVEPRGGAPQATTEITRYDPNHVTILASTSANGFLFLSDSHYPDWKAYVDGVRTESYQADYAFRAVYLPAGQHTVEFIYEPESFKPTSRISLLTLIGSIVLLVSPWSQKAGEAIGSSLGER